MKMPLLPINDRRKKLLKIPQMFSRLIVAGIPIEDLLNKKVLIVGAGGLGAIVAEILARTGIKEILVVDRDVVGEANFNRLGFSREDIGKPKSMALAKKLESLRNSPDMPKKYHITTKWYKADIIGWDLLEDLISNVDLVFSCVDNEVARRELNYLIMKLKKPMIDGGTAPDGLSGTVITIIPCRTPCYECYYGSSTSIRVNNIEKIGYCDASIATTMTIVASIQADQGLKLLLNFGKVYPFIKIDLRSDIILFPNEKVSPRKDCAVHKRFCK